MQPRHKLVIAALVLFAIAGGVAWWLVRSIDAKAELERVLSDALGREVTIGVLDVDPRGHVALRDVDIANPPGWGDAPLLHAGELDIDVELSTLLDREVVGVVTVRAVDLRVVKANGTTNLHGMFPKRGGGKPIDLHLDLAIHAAHVELEDRDRGESLALDGVDVRVLASNRDGEQQGDARLTIASVGLHGVTMRDVSLRVLGDGERVAIEDLRGTVGKAGTVTGSGSLFLGGDKGWQFELAAQHIDLASDVAAVVSTLYPPLASSVESTAATGFLAGSFTLSGRGLHWAQIEPTLAGKGRITLTDVVLPRESLLLAIAALAGREGESLTLTKVELELALADRWITLERVSSDAQSVAVPVTGRVSLSGELDLKVELMPLVQAFGGGAYAGAAKYTTSIPVRVRGTTKKPELAPPRAEDLAKGLLGGALRRALGPE
ncbi:MAG TPA: AsmA-like C-terminal region-containing protein [Nannocystaceae bacterium]|nr:AsmA-like C-terminal region-containing protein [Nannocystaceae bacterium]